MKMNQVFFSACVPQAAGQVKFVKLDLLTNDFIQWHSGSIARDPDRMACLMINF